MHNVLLTNSGDMFQSWRPHETIKHLILLLKDPEAAMNILPQKPVLVLDIENVTDTHQQRCLPDLGPQSHGILTRDILSRKVLIVL